MPYPFLTILTGRNLPKIRQSREPEPSVINEKTIADFTRVVDRRDFWSASRRSTAAPLGLEAAYERRDRAGRLYR